MAYRFMLFLLLFFKAIQLSSQCTPPSSNPVSCIGTELTDNTAIGNGQTYVFTGPPTTFTNISLNGGTLTICSSLIITNLNFNGGKLIISPTGSLNFSQSVSTLSAPDQDITNQGTLIINSGFNVNANSEIINEGTMTFTVSTIEDGEASVVYNGSGAILNLTGISATLNSTFINYGKCIFDNLTINSGGAICMGPGASVETRDFGNNQLNAASVLSGNACISYSGSSVMNQVLTNTTGLIICKHAGAGNPMPMSFGTATVVSSCISCEVALPVSLLEFTATANGNQVTLNWASVTEDNVEKYVIEKNEGTNSFVPIGEVAAAGRAQRYNFTTAITSPSLFRLRMVDRDAKYSYSRVVSVRFLPTGNTFRLQSNPVINNRANVSITSPQIDKGELILYDEKGRIVKKMQVNLSKGTTFISLPLDNISNGIYLLIFKNAVDRLGPLKLLKTVQ